MDSPSILKFDTAREAALACGARTFELLEAARRERGVASIAVSGGSTPKIMFEWMAAQKFDWTGVEIFQVDERCVPPDDQQSNFRMMNEAWLKPAGIPAVQVHRALGELEPEVAKQRYIEEIRRVLKLGADELPVFDVIQRGMGPDAHTASLFPGEPMIADETGLAAALWVEKMHQHRVTLLRGVLEKARATLCLVSGPGKAVALKSVLEQPFEPQKYPCQIASSGMVWFLDKAAAAEL